MVTFAIAAGSNAPRVARDVRMRYLIKSSHSVPLEEIAKLYTKPPETATPPRFLADATRFADNFTSHADGIRYVHDIDKDQHVDFLHSLVASEVHRSWHVQDAVYAISDDGLDAFTLHLLAVSGNPLALMLRFKVNDGGQIEDLWRKRGLIQREIDALTKDPELVLSRLNVMPQLELDEMEENSLREARMLAAVDKFFKEFDLHCAGHDEDRWDRIVDFTTDDFQQWDATGLWKWPSGSYGALNREGLLREIDYLQDHFGAASGAGRTHAVMQAKAANSARNVAFLHFHVIGSAKNRPCALDKMVAFTFNSDGTKIRQAMLLRSAASIQEYASVFKAGEECALDA